MWRGFANLRRVVRDSGRWPLAQCHEIREKNWCGGVATFYYRTESTFGPGDSSHNEKGLTGCLNRAVFAFGSCGWMFERRCLREDVKGFLLICYMGDRKVCVLPHCAFCQTVRFFICTLQFPDRCGKILPRKQSKGSLLTDHSGMQKSLDVNVHFGFLRSLYEFVIFGRLLQLIWAVRSSEGLLLVARSFGEDKERAFLIDGPQLPNSVIYQVDSCLSNCEGGGLPLPVRAQCASSFRKAG
jgi:hypothetical protein